MYDKIIWNYLKNNNLTDAGTAGLMGNLYAESGLNPTNLQNTFNKKLSMTDKEYTFNVDYNNYKNFTHDGAGYGLAQWTFYTRKQNLLNFCKSRKTSIGDLSSQLDFLMLELNNGYKNLIQVLKTTDSVQEASNRVLIDFERPADQSDSMKNKRYQFGLIFFNKFSQQATKEGENKMKYNENNPPLKCFQFDSKCYKETRPMKIHGILWHSTGANNPNLKRYIQPSKKQEGKSYSKLIKIIGTNPNGNDYNHAQYNSGLNAFIGKNANGDVMAVQTMPWEFRPWGCGAGKKGSCNNGWIQFEICEDNLNDPIYFNEIYKESCELTAYLCKIYNINPNGYVIMGKTKIPTILCHADSYKLGFGSNHGDVLHWFLKYGKTMEDVRTDVLKLLNNENIHIENKPQEKDEEDEDMTQERFNELMNEWINTQAEKEPNNWSKDARDWAENARLINGDEKGRKMYKKNITREELVQVLYRALHRNFL